jgi:hypothetical protein
MLLTVSFTPVGFEPDQAAGREMLANDHAAPQLPLKLPLCTHSRQVHSTIYETAVIGL